MDSSSVVEDLTIDWSRARHYFRETFLSAITDLLVWILVLLFVTWPFEFLIFSETIIWQNALWRIAAVLLIGSYLGGVKFSDTFRSLAVPVYVIFVSIGCLWLGHVVGQQPESRLFFTFLSIMAPFAAIIVPLRLSIRFPVAILFPASLITTYYYTKPVAFADPTIVVRLLFVAASVVLCALLGNVLYDLQRRNYRNRERMDYLANHDSETGLFNTEYIEETLEVEIERSRRYGTDLSLALIRIDNLSKIQSEYGQATINNVLEEMGNVIMESIRTSDLAGRVDENDFCVMLPETDKQGSVTFAERMKEDVLGRKIESETGETLDLECQVGLVELDERIKDVDEFLDRAVDDLNGSVT